MFRVNAFQISNLKIKHHLPQFNIDSNFLVVQTVLYSLLVWIISVASKILALAIVFGLAQVRRLKPLGEKDHQSIFINKNKFQPRAFSLILAHTRPSFYFFTYTGGTFLFLEYLNTPIESWLTFFMVSLMSGSHGTKEYFDCKYILLLLDNATWQIFYLIVTIR